MPARLENGSVYFEGSPKENRAAFLAYAEPKVHILRDGEYGRKFGPRYPYARFYAQPYLDDNDIPYLTHMSISVDADAFKVEGTDYEDLIPILVTHEIEELWSFVKTGVRCGGGIIFLTDSQAHAHAVREQYRYAFSVGKAERYLEFLKASAPVQYPNTETREIFLNENLAAYTFIKSRQRSP